MNHPRTITALVVAEDEVVRVGLRLLLRNMTPVRHVVEAARRDEAVRLARTVGYDVAVLDASDAASGRPLELVRALAAVLPEAPLVLYTDDGFDLSEYCLRSGLTCSVSPRGPHSATRLCQAVRQFLSAAAAPVHGTGRGAAGDADVVAALTLKERQVLGLLTSGHSSKSIARSMRVSLRTVESHRARICAKLGVRTVPALTKVALRAGLTSLDDEQAAPPDEVMNR